MTGWEWTQQDPQEERGRILLVESDPAERDRLGSWLQAAGFDVLTCPGPREPDFTCIGTKYETCPLAQVADAVVLDLLLESDMLMTGTTGWELLLYYGSLGKPVVALSDANDAVRPTPGGAVALVRRPPERGALVDAVMQVGPGAFERRRRPR